MACWGGPRPLKSQRRAACGPRPLEKTYERPPADGRKKDESAARPGPASPSLGLKPLGLFAFPCDSLGPGGVPGQVRYRLDPGADRATVPPLTPRGGTAPTSLARGTLPDAPAVASDIRAVLCVGLSLSLGLSLQLRLTPL